MERRFEFCSDKLDPDPAKDDLALVRDFYNYLQGKNIEGVGVESPVLTAEQAFRVIYYLQEHLPVIPDTIEQCSKCCELYDTMESGNVCGGCEKHFCNQCDALIQCNKCGDLLCEVCQEFRDVDDEELCSDCRKKK